MEEALRVCLRVEMMIRERDGQYTVVKTMVNDYATFDSNNTRYQIITLPLNSIVTFPYKSRMSLLAFYRRRKLVKSSDSQMINE